jgi:alpha-aminoadipate carrier protein LysW
MAKAECPACSARINLGSNPRIGQRVKCASCYAELEVVWLDPIELDWPYDEDEYEDYDESYYEEQTR